MIESPVTSPSQIVLWWQVQAAMLAQSESRRLAKARRNQAMAAILARLEAARRDNAQTYLAARAQREHAA